MVKEGGREEGRRRRSKNGKKGRWGKRNTWIHKYTNLADQGRVTFIPCKKKYDYISRRNGQQRWRFFLLSPFSLAHGHMWNGLMDVVIYKMKCVDNSFATFPIQSTYAFILPAIIWMAILRSFNALPSNITKNVDIYLHNSTLQKIINTGVMPGKWRILISPNRNTNETLPVSIVAG